MIPELFGDDNLNDIVDAADFAVYAARRGYTNQCYAPAMALAISDFSDSFSRAPWTSTIREAR